MLTEKQSNVLKYIQKYFETHGEEPSIRQIGGYFSLTSRAVQQHIVALKRKGFLVYRKPQTAAYVLPSNSKRKLPVLGETSHSAEAISFEIGLEELELSPMMFSSNEKVFVLPVQDNRMSGDHISVGDLAIVEQVEISELSCNEIVAVCVDPGVYMLTRVQDLAADVFELTPSDPAMVSMHVASSQVKIMGRYVGLVRRTLH